MALEKVSFLRGDALAECFALWVGDLLGRCSLFLFLESNLERLFLIFFNADGDVGAPRDHGAF